MSEFQHDLFFLKPRKKYEKDGQYDSKEILFK